MKFTPAQKKAIDHAGSALLVSAAAGSGKTAVLVERAVRMLCDETTPAPADQLLIVTFTKAAAASLRAKLTQRLGSEIMANPANSYLRRQRLLLQRAPICTIDAYCRQLVQTHFSALDIPPDFDTADGPQLAALRAQSLADAMETAYEDSNFCAFADLYGKGRSDRQAAEIVDQLHTFLSSLPDPAATLKDFCNQWRAEEPLGQSLWGKALLAEGLQGVNAALELTAASLATIESDDGLAPYLPAIESDNEALAALLAPMQAGEWEAVRNAFKGLSYQRLGSVRKYTGPNKEAVQARRDMVKKILARLQEKVFFCTEEEFEADRKAALPLIEALVAAERNFDRLFMQAKLEEKQLEFSDVEQLALQLLLQNGQPTALAQEISQTLFAVMVDEYQDTNALQDALYHSLAGPGGDKLFFVGDLKQSIYRFRQADPSIFQDKLERYAPIGGTGPQKVFLDANFRSAPGVIAAINGLFSSLMSRQVGGVAYGAGEKLVPGFEGGEGYGGYLGGCEIRLVESDRPCADADYIAGRIHQLMAPESDFTVRCKEGTRPPHYDDFCILLRNRSGFDAYACALEAVGIPVYVDRAENLLDAPEIRPIASLLRVLDNPAQDVHLAAVMLNLCGFEPDDLVRMRTGQPKGSFYGAVMADETPKMQQFAAWLAALRQLSQTMCVDRLMEEIFLRTGWLAAVGAMPEGLIRRENLRRFSAFVSGCGKNGLPGVVRAMDAALATGGISGGDQATSRPGCVTIMTIHRSKGLEFPVVFAADLGHGFNKEDLRAAAVFHPMLGAGLTLRAGAGGTYATAAYRAVQTCQFSEAISEEMRVFYVAVTRAQDKLVLSATLKQPDRLLARLAALRTGQTQLSPYLLKHCQNRAEWVLLCALGHPSGTALQARVAVPLETDRVDLPGCMEISIEEDTLPEIAPIAETGLPVSLPDASLLAAVSERLQWQYPRKALIDVPAKVSVTALVHKAQELSLQRPAFLYKEGLTAAERGTALHAFLQYADLAAAKIDPKAEAQRQMNAKLLLPELYDRMDFQKLNTFFASDTYRRIESAKTVHREFAFITAISAEQAMGQTGDYKNAKTLVQGVADLLLEFSDHLEILDYKTDAGKADFVKAYRPQLLMYAAAIDSRFEKPVTRLSIYSFDLGREIPVKM